MEAMNTSEKCAACGKGSDSLKTCNGCKAVKYCNTTCQKAHRRQHKNECKLRPAELERRLASLEIGKCASVLPDDLLFKKPPPRDECPICFLQLPCEGENVYQPCCGKILCFGCVFEATKIRTKKCPFCRETVHTSHKERMDRYNKRMNAGDAYAYYMMGTKYLYGDDGITQDIKKAYGLLLRATKLGSTNDLGSTNAHLKLASMCVKIDPNAALYHYQQAALGGNEMARYKLGCIEENAGNIDKAIKHFTIAVGTGHKESLDIIRTWFVDGHATKARNETALREYQAYIDEVKSDHRDGGLANIQRWRSC